VVALIEGRRQRRELRDKVGQVVSAHYWPAEADVSRLLRDVETMRGAELFRDVNAFDVLAFKYRFRRPLVADDPAPLNPGPARPPNALQTLRRVERLLDSLALQVAYALRTLCMVPLDRRHRTLRFYHAIKSQRAMYRCALRLRRVRKQTKPTRPITTFLVAV